MPTVIMPSAESSPLRRPDGGVRRIAANIAEDDPITKNWTLVDELGGAHSVQLAVNDVLEIGLQRVEPAALVDEQPEVLWESED
jgi:hypothetical protein